VFRVKTLRKEIVAEEKINKARMVKKVEKKLTREKFGVKELSRFEFVEKEAAPLLSDELPKGLVGAGGASASTQDLLVDRFKSLQKRNVIEPRIKQK
jgi:nucleolar protein 53